MAHAGRAMTRLFGLAMCAALAGGAGAEVISFQDPTTGDNAYCAQVFEEVHDDMNVYQIDDLDLGDKGYHLESAVTYWLYGIVEPQYYRIRTYSDLPDSCDPDQYFLKEYSGIAGEHDAEGRWVVTFDLEGDAYASTIWIAAYVRANYHEHGTDMWYNANAENLGYDPNGSEEYFWWWGVDWGPPCWPVPGSEYYHETADMSWKIEGTPIPEPGLLALVVAAALFGGHLRRRQM